LFVAIVGSDSMGDISIDDVYFTSGSCKDSGAIGDSCSFTDMTQCGFTQNATASSLTWRTYSGGSNQLQTTPISYDHTTGTSSGSYVYVDLENQGEKLNGRLYSQLYSAVKNDSYCLEFYYVLLGSNNTFTVYSESSTGSNRPIFTRNYDHGLIWNKGEATISALSSFRINFEIYTGYYRKGFVALDDYSLKEGQCSFQSNECTFDDGTLCSWTNAKDNTFDWLLHTGSTPTISTGPDGDHSTL